ncbi:hypothetical protein DESME_05620 [Desulfitobacterium metallireducens DSM 15288]|uniref:Uncharacterized protein n=1 Tax=Desulfitobacterium metallireducens DSM 15288 TaxID=871968 RepID=W0EH20_9FIRM|nr:hypothetical protein DESME_05620 [Desulfitobacterium metallireducens DSM 15288]
MKILPPVRYRVHLLSQIELCFLDVYYYHDVNSIERYESTMSGLISFFKKGFIFWLLLYTIYMRDKYLSLSNLETSSSNKRIKEGD